MTVPNVIGQAKAYYNNDNNYVIQFQRDKSTFTDQMEKVIIARNKITQKIISFSKGKIDST